jgi:hypothetical protein
MVDEVLFEHETPSLDDVEQRLFERLGVHAEPVLKDHHWVDLLGFLVDLLIRVDLETHTTKYGYNMCRSGDIYDQIWI